MNTSDKVLVTSKMLVDHGVLDQLVNFINEDGLLETLKDVKGASDLLDSLKGHLPDLYNHDAAHSADRLYRILKMIKQ